MTDNYTWYAPEDPTPREQCPCCDYISLPERGNYLICNICFWEDDGIDCLDEGGLDSLDRLDEISGPNHITLREGRANFKKFGACRKDMVKHVLPEKERSKFKFVPRIVD